MTHEELVEQLGANDRHDRLAAAAALATEADGIDLLVNVVGTPGPFRRERRRIAIEGLKIAARRHPSRRSTIVDVLGLVLQDPDVAWEAAQCLVDIAPDRALLEFSTLVFDADSPTAKPLAMYLSLLAESAPETRPSLIEPLSRLLRGATSVRDVAASGLALIDDERAFQALLAATGYHPQRMDNHIALLDALVRSPRSTSHVPEVVAVLTVALHSDASLTRAAARLLARFPEGRTYLRGQLSQDHVAPDAAVALGEARDRESVPLLLDMVPRAGWHTSLIIKALGSIGDPASAPQIAHLIPTLPGAAAVLTRLGGAGMRELIYRFDDPDESVRHAVRSAIRNRRSDFLSVIPIEVVDATPAERGEIGRVLAWLDPPSALVHLRPLLEDPAPEVRLTAVDAIAGIRLDRPASSLVPLLNDAVPAIRAATINALSPWAASISTELTSLLQDDSVHVRHAAVTALGMAPGTRLEALRDLLRQDPEEVVVAAAARSLSASGPAATLNLLTELFSRPELAVREAAAQAVGSFARMGIAAIEAASASADPLVRASASMALAASEQSYAPKVMNRLVNDDDSDVRVQALRSVSYMATEIVDLELVNSVMRRLHSGCEQEQIVAARALARMTGADVGLTVARALASSISSGQSSLARACILAISDALQAIPAERDGLPGWYAVDDGIRTAAARLVHDALQGSRRAGGRTARFAETAILAIENAVDRSREIRELEYPTKWSAPRAPAAAERVSDMAAVRRPVDPVLPLEVAVENAAGPRYLDATFYQNGVPIPPGSPLRENDVYDLEVAVRLKTTGMPAVGGRTPFARTPPSADLVEITVALETDRNLSVEQPVARLSLPAEGESTRNAWFRIQADMETLPGTGDRRATIRIRMFFLLNLLESAIIRAEVVSRFRPNVRSSLELAHPIVLEHERIERGYEALDAAEERSLHIDVGRQGTAYTLRFTLSGQNGQVMSLPAPSPLLPAELTSLLRDARGILHGIAMGEAYALKLQPNGQ